MLRRFTCLAGHAWEAEAGDDDVPACPACGHPADVVSPFDEPAPFAPPTDSQPIPVRAANRWPVVPGFDLKEKLPDGPLGVERYRARQAVADRDVRLDVVVAKDDPGQTAWGALRGEARALAKLDHPNVARLLAVGERDRQVFYNVVAEAGWPTLDEWLDGKALPWWEAVALVRILAGAVRHAHHRGVVHRAIQPRFVRVAPAAEGEPGAVRLRYQWRRPVLEGFGLAKAKTRDNEPADLELQPDLPAYLAPEQALGRPALVGPATDVYALGVLLAELVTGRSPLAGATRMETLERVLEPSPRLLDPVRAAVPAAVFAVIERAMEPRVKHRYATANDLAAALDGLTPAAGTGWRPFALGLALGLVVAVVAALSGVLPGAPHRKSRAEVPSADEPQWARPLARRFVIQEAQKALAANDRAAATRWLSQVPLADWTLECFLLADRATDRHQRLTFPKETVRCLAVSADGLRLAVGTGAAEPPGRLGGLRISSAHDLEARTTTVTLPNESIRSVVFPNAGRFVALVGERVLAWDSSQYEPTVLHADKAAIDAVALLDDGRSLAILNGRVLTVIDTGRGETIRRLDETARTEVALRMDRRPGAVPGPADQLRRIFLTAGRGPRLTLRDVGPAWPDDAAPPEGDAATALCPTGPFATGHANGAIRVWDRFRPTTRFTLTGHTAEVVGLAAPERGQRLFSLDRDGWLRVWSLDDGTERLALRFPPDEARGEPVAIACADRILAVAFAHEVLVWNDLDPR